MTIPKRKNWVNGREVPPISEIPFYPPSMKIPKEDVIRYGLDSVYRYMFARGRGATRRDKTWDRKRWMHTCCKCRSPWRHFARCKLVLAGLDF